MMLLDNIAKGSRVAVAMSGGVDSSVAAALMIEQGYEVIGITLQLYDHGEMTQRKGTCCAGQDIYDARMVAEQLGFPHYVLDYENVFKQSVIDDFVDSYIKGETPIPCIRCNQRVKFRDLLKTSQDLEAKALITGHYVQRLQGPKRVELHRAVDVSKDQSYFLFTTTQAQLDYLHFPLGGFSKNYTRLLAKKFGLKVSNKPDSQNICFVPNGNYVSVVEKLRPGALEKGDIVHIDGRLLGQHNGLIHYTVGQRKGLRVATGGPLFVIRLEVETKRVIVGPKEALATTVLYVKDVNWLEEKSEFEQGYKGLVKIRSTHSPISATIYK
ncbi:MAG: tRNA 2-thiouridine(34) synthase MnmA, partial [Proteobacteria bacterium]|nr:tRNA 2-thiouridine(34) synthase MnmA [Pseudomonadota bacterium]